MYPLLGFGFLVPAIGLYRITYLLFWTRLPARPGNAVAWNEEIRQVLETGESVPGLTVLETIEVLLSRLEDSLSRGMLTLRFLAQNAGLLGFLGTVMGMIKTFHAVARKGTVAPAELAGGIHEALYTTLFGLAVAIAGWSFAYLIEGMARGHIRRIEGQIVRTLTRRKSLPT